MYSINEILRFEERKIASDGLNQSRLTHTAQRDLFIDAESLKHDHFKLLLLQNNTGSGQMQVTVNSAGSFYVYMRFVSIWIQL